MKCYVHPGAEAVGVCSTCGRGVCRSCAVKLGGKVLCKEDAERVFKTRKVIVSSMKTLPDKQQRGIGVVLGAVFAYLLGGVAAVVSFLVIFDAILGGNTSGADTPPFFSIFTPNLSFLGALQQYPAGSILNVGVALLVFGSAGIAAGFIMWKPSRVGAGFAVVFGVVGIAAAFELDSISANSLLVDSWFTLSGLVILASFIGLVQLVTGRGKR